MSSLPINPPNSTQPSLTFSSVITPETISTYTTSNYISNISNILINNINTKQNILTASTNILGIGSSISALDYAKITLNKPSTFPADMTNIYNKTEVNTISNNNSNYTTITSNILSNLINTNSNYTTITSNILNTKIDVNNINISNILYNTNYTDERQYPPKLYNASSVETTATGEITNILPTTVYKQTITLDNTGITYGSGDYIIYSSSIYTPGAADQTQLRKRDLFNYNLDDIGGHWTDSYNGSTGNYNGNNYIKSDYLGDWIIIKLPNPIFLQRFRFYARLNYVIQAPTAWRCYGSTDGNNFTEINSASNDTTPLTLASYDANRMYEKIVNANISYNYIGFTFNKKIIDASQPFLCFAELQLFGKEILSLTPAYITSNDFNTAINTKENTLIFNSPLTRTTNTIGISLGSYYNKTETDNLLTNKQATLTFTTPLTNTANTVSIDLSSKENVLTFNSPLTRTTNTIGINLGSYYNKTETDNLINTKQNTLTASTILSGIGSNITLINYNTLSNLPSTFPANMTNIYNKTETNNIINTKQNTLTASTILSGIGSNITLINYNTLSNLPSTFPPTMTNIYNKTEIDSITSNIYSTDIYERQYPPKAFTSSTNEGTATGELTNILPTTFFKQTITLDNTGITYGFGDYIIYSSSKYSAGDQSLFRKRDLFNYNLNDVGGHWELNNYNEFGNYNGNNYIKSDYLGDWIMIKLPNRIFLQRFRFYARLNLVNQAPSVWRCYGSTDGIVFTEINSASNEITPLTLASYDANRMYEKIVNANISYNYIGFTFNKKIIDASQFALCFAELQLFGKEQFIEPFYISSRILNSTLNTNYYNKTSIDTLTSNIYSTDIYERQYPPKLYNASSVETTATGELQNILPTTFYKQTIILDTNGITYGSGEYIIYSSSIYTIGDQTQLRKRDLFNYNLNDVGGHWNSNYNGSTGNYNGNNYIKSDYLGDWIIIKLPNPIFLQRFRFYARLNTVNQAPTAWRCYGSTNGINFTEINSASNEITPLTLASYDANRMYEKIVNANISYNYIGFTFNKKIIDALQPFLCFAELQLFGREVQPFYISSNVFNSTLTNTSNTLNTSINTKENVLTFNSPLTRTTNTIGINLGSYYNKTETDNLLTNKQNALTFTSPLTNTANNISIDLSSKENVLSFNSPLTRTANTIGINLGSYSTTGNDANYLLKSGGTITGNLTLNSSLFMSSTQSINFSKTPTSTWIIEFGTSPSGVADSFIFFHRESSPASKSSRWWFNGAQATTNSEISDERIKKEINDIQTPLNKIMELKPKQYYLCDDKDYNKKFGIIAQDVEKVFPELIHTQKDYVANIYSYATYDNKVITLEQDITELINIDDELKIILDNNDKNNLEIVIDDTPYNNRYKKRFIKVVEIIDNHSFKIDIDLEINEIFIYGKKVDDFKRLDYESLYCLNIAATQELYKIIQLQQQQIEELKQRIL